MTQQNRNLTIEETEILKQLTKHDLLKALLFSLLALIIPALIIIAATWSYNNTNDRISHISVVLLCLICALPFLMFALEIKKLTDMRHALKTGTLKCRKSILTPLHSLKLYGPHTPLDIEIGTPIRIISWNNGFFDEEYIFAEENFTNMKGETAGNAVK